MSNSRESLIPYAALRSNLAKVGSLDFSKPISTAHLFFGTLSVVNVEKTPFGATGWRPRTSKAYDLPDNNRTSRTRKQALFIIRKNNRKCAYCQSITAFSRDTF